LNKIWLHLVFLKMKSAVNKVWVKTTMVEK
jgi:hypothetical protein